MVPRVTVVAVTAAVAVLACASFTGVQAIAPEPAECPAGTVIPSVFRIRHYNGQEDVWVTDQCDPSLVQAGDCEGEDFQIGGTQYWVLADNGRDHEDKVPCTSDYEEPLDDSDSEYAFLTADYGFDSSSYDQTLGVTFDTTYSTGLAFFDNTALNDNVDIHTDGSNIDNSWDALDLPPSSPFSVDGSTAGGGDITFEHHNDAGFADSYNDYWADAWTPTNSDGVVDGFYDVLPTTASDNDVQTDANHIDGSYDLYDASDTTFSVDGGTGSGGDRTFEHHSDSSSADGYSDYWADYGGPSSDGLQDAFFDSPPSNAVDSDIIQ